MIERVTCDKLKTSLRLTCNLISKAFSNCRRNNRYGKMDFQEKCCLARQERSPLPAAQKMKKNSTTFFDIYGSRDELTPDVADEDVPKFMQDSKNVRTKRNGIVSLLS